MMYFYFDEGREITSDSTLAKHIRELLAYAKQTLNINLQFDWPARYASALEDAEGIIDCLEDFTQDEH